MAGYVLLHKISAFFNTLCRNKTIAAVIPTLVFLFGCSFMTRRFINRLQRAPRSSSRIFEVLISTSIVIQFMRLWALVVSSVDALTEFTFTQILDKCEFSNSSLLCYVFNPNISGLVVCILLSLIPWGMLVIMNRDQNHFANSLIAWVRMTRWSRTEIGMSFYFLENPMTNRTYQRGRTNSRFQGRRRSRDRQEQPKLGRSKSCQDFRVSINVGVRESHSV